jgi:ABC-type uncharacterized transport system involved in gliding motility auxiliary subunit/ABC-type transport system involved in multi-copper enzyme maturation permease subunit
MNGFCAVLRREWSHLFATPLAYLFIGAYGALTTIATFEFGDLYGRGQADLSSCFALQPWLIAWLAPALSMRLWAEERRHGTAEALLVLPIALRTMVVAKWVAALGVFALALATTLPLWLTITYLGHPDHGTVLAGYVGSALLGAALLSLGSAVSATTRHPVGAFLLTTALAFVLLVSAHPLVIDSLRERLPSTLLDTLSDLGALAHYRALVRGTIGLDDVLYFSAVTLVGLTATGVVINAVRNLPTVVFGRPWPAPAVLLALTGLLALGASALPRWVGSWRLDLTEERLYTLAPTTLRLLGDLDQPVLLTLYASNRTLDGSPGYASEARRVRELLADMTARARDRLHLSVIDPGPFSEDEDRAAEVGLRPLNLGETGDSLWLGLVAERAGARAVIDLFEPSEAPFLEYRIARLIRQVARPHRPVIGLLTTLPLIGTSDGLHTDPAAAETIGDALREQYDVREVLPEQRALPSGLDALVVLQPKGLAPELVRAIDQYVGSGGRTLVAVDPDAQFDGQADDSAVGIDHASTLEPLLSRWGIHFDPNQAVGDLDNALLVANGGADRPVRHLGFMGIGADGLSSDDMVTRGLHRINLATPGYLEISAPPGVSVTPLLQTSAASAPIRVADLAVGVTPETLRHGFRPTGQRYTLAAHLRGVLPSPAATTARPADVVVIADTDWLADVLWIRDERIGDTRYREPWANNGDLLLNIVDELSGGDALVGLRGREPMARPFTHFDAIRARADRRLAAQSEALERALADVNRQIAALTERHAATPPGHSEQAGDLAQAELERRRLSRAVRALHHELDREAARLGKLLYALDVLVPGGVVLVCAIVLLGRRRSRARA